MFVRLNYHSRLSLKVEGRFFLYFYIFIKASKYPVSEIVGGISCYSTNPSLTTYANKCVLEGDNNEENCVYLDFLTP